MKYWVAGRVRVPVGHWTQVFSCTTVFRAIMGGIVLIFLDIAARMNLSLSRQATAMWAIGKQLLGQV